MADFYDYIIPKIRDYFYNHKEKNLVFNFADLRFISPNIVPNLLNIADIYKKYFRNDKNITLKLSWNPDLLSILYSLHFFEISDRSNLFSYNRDMLGGFDLKSTDNCNLIFSNINSSEDEIKRECEQLMQSMKRCIEIEIDIKEHNDTFLEIFFHLIHNANDKDRGNSNAYGSFKVNSYKERNNNKYDSFEKNSPANKAYIAVCDNGVGIMKSINNKFHNNEAKPYFTKYNKTAFYYILEAIFWRKINPPTPFIHGLYDVTKIVLERGGQIGINSDETYIVFTKNFLNTFRILTDTINRNDEPDTETQIELKNIYMKKTQNIRYQGVHIDIEMPLEKKR